MDRRLARAGRVHRRPQGYRLGLLAAQKALDVTGVAPLAGAANMAAAMRADVVTDGGYPDKVLSNAPERIGDFFAVPKVVE